MKNSSLWHFAAAIYGHDEVSKACLFLQDECGVDVNVLLFALWMAAERKIQLDAATVQKIDAAVRQWREQVVMPLRAVRRRMKTGPAPAPNEKTEELRGKLKEVEIESERIELSVLEGLDLGPLPQAADKPVTQNTLCVVSAYGGKTADKLVAQAIASIAAVVKAAV